MTRVLLLVFACAWGCEEKKAPTPVPAVAQPAPAAAALLPAGTKTKCPVTGEDFVVDEKSPQLVHEGKAYAFCCADCLPDFKKNPEKFAKK